MIWLVVAPAYPQSFRLCIAALPLLAARDEWQVFVPDAPRTTQLYCHAQVSRPHVAARRYHSLRESPALHPPERPAPLAISLIGHASQHALPRQRGERIGPGTRYVFVNHGTHATTHCVGVRLRRNNERRSRRVMFGTMGRGRISNLDCGAGKLTMFRET